jgi:hypothetical protein
MSSIDKLTAQRRDIDRKIATASLEPLTQARDAFTSPAMKGVESDMASASAALAQISPDAVGTINNAVLAVRNARDVIARTLATVQNAAEEPPAQ